VPSPHRAERGASQSQADDTAHAPCWATGPDPRPAPVDDPIAGSRADRARRRATDLVQLQVGRAGQLNVQARRAGARLDFIRPDIWHRRDGVVARVLDGAAMHVDDVRALAGATAEIILPLAAVAAGSNQWRHSTQR